ncbi:MAG: tRNA pseudouridine(38-40) synthase TruA [Halioglobus sp.]|nr:tRNA pseudouridine(38-40) synthase TruA [Halioglobus sp.]
MFSPDLIGAETRVACRVEYDGSAYNGWQLQPHEGVVTVQEKLELALSQIAAQPVRVHCAGRTDTGVHAFSQIIHFDAPVARSCKAWVVGGNANLPRDIRIHWSVPVTDDFHARFSAESRCYRYVIANTPIRSALLLNQVTWHRRQLDQLAMHTAAQTLLGERDFSAFRAASCQSASPMRNVEHIDVQRRGDLLIIEIVANAFLHHMVRNIAGALLAVGDGRKSVDWIVRLMAGRDRSLGVETAPASGLYLADVQYPNHRTLPRTPYGPMLLGTML